MENKNCPSKGFWRALIIIAAVIGTFVAVGAILEKVFKKYLKITVELEDIDDLDDDCCCCDDDDLDDCCCEDDDCCCEDDCCCNDDDCCCCESEDNSEESGDNGEAADAE